MIRSSFSSATDSFQTQSTTRELDAGLDHDLDARPISETGNTLARSPAPLPAPVPDAADTALPQLPPPRPSFSSHSALRVSRASSKQQRPAPFDNAPVPAAAAAPDTMASPQIHRRTTSSLRTVMRKIFTRKRRSQTDDLDELALSAPQECQETTADIAEHGHGHGSLAAPARVSNSLASKHRDLTNVEIRADPEIASEASDPTPGRRRATLPSLIFDDDQADQQSRHSQDDAGKCSPRRRSRSVNGIRRLADGQSPIWRRDTNRPRRGSVPATASDSEISLRPATSTSVASAPTASVDTSISGSQTEPEEEESLAPDVNVGYFVNSMQHDDNASPEQRLTTLEVKLIDLEFAIARMQNREPPFEKEKEKPKKSTRYKHSRKQSADPHPHPHHPPVEEAPRDDRPLSTSTIRPTPSPAIRLPISCSDSETQTQPLMLTPTPALPVNVPATTDFTGISVEQYSALVTLLRREQSARRNLEAQIGSLQDDVRRLQFGNLPAESLSDSASLAPELGSTPPTGPGTGTAPGAGTRYPIRSTDSRDFFRWRNGSETEGSSSSSPRVRPRPWPPTGNGNGIDNPPGNRNAMSIPPAGLPDSSDSDWDRSDTSAYPSPLPRRDRERSRSSRGMGKWPERRVESSNRAEVMAGGMI